MGHHVLGGDLSITAAGLALTATHTITVGGMAKLGDRRLCIIKGEVRRHLRAAQLAGAPYTLAVIEGPGFSSTRLFAVAMVHGVVRDALIDFGVPYLMVPPTTLKAFATGNGGPATDKAAMLAAARQHTNHRFADDNQVDAWWARRMGCAWLGDHHGLRPEQLDRLNSVKWPIPAGT